MALMHVSRNKYTLESKKEIYLASTAFHDEKLFNENEILTHILNFKKKFKDVHKENRFIVAFPSKVSSLTLFQFLLFFSSKLTHPALFLSESLFSTQESQWSTLFANRIRLFEPPTPFAYFTLCLTRFAFPTLCIIGLITMTTSLHKKLLNEKETYQNEEAQHTKLTDKFSNLNQAAISSPLSKSITEWTLKIDAWHNNPSVLCSLIATFPQSLGRLTLFELIFEQKIHLATFEGVGSSHAQLSSFLTLLEEKTKFSSSLETLKTDPAVPGYFFKINLNP